MEEKLSPRGHTTLTLPAVQLKARCDTFGRPFTIGLDVMGSTTEGDTGARVCRKQNYSVLQDMSATDRRHGWLSVVHLNCEVPL